MNARSKFFIATLGFLLTFSIPAMAKDQAKKKEVENWKLDTSHSKIGFEISHLVIATVDGRFNKFSGTYKFNREKKKIKDLKVEIEASSIDTNEPDRDKHLRGDDFFDVNKYPKITFKGTKVTFKGDKPVSVTGELKIKKKEKKITLDIDWKGEVTDPWGNHKSVFELSGKINRKDFGLDWNKTLDKGGLMIGEEVKLVIKIEANEVK